MKTKLLILLAFAALCVQAQTVQIIQQDARDKLITASYDTTANKTLQPQAVKRDIDTAFVEFYAFQSVIGAYTSFILQSAKYSFSGSDGKRVIVYKGDRYSIIYRKGLTNSEKTKFDNFCDKIKTQIELE